MDGDTGAAPKGFGFREAESESIPAALFATRPAARVYPGAALRLAQSGGPRTLCPRAPAPAGGRRGAVSPLQGGNSLSLLRSRHDFFPRPAHPRPAPAAAAATGKLLRHHHPRIKQSAANQNSAQPVLTPSKSVRPGSGGSCPEAADYALYMLKARPHPCFQASAEPSPGVKRTFKAPVRPSSLTRWRQKPDLSEEERPEALPTDAPATNRS